MPYHRRRCDFGNLLDYLLIHRRGNLSAIAPEDLIAVIFLRIMRSRHHHTGYRALGPYAVRKLGSRTYVVEKKDVYTIGAQHFCSDVREFAAVVAAIVRHAHRLPFLRLMGQYILGQPLRSHSHGIDIHTIRSHAHNAAKTSRTEFERLVKSIFELRLVTGHKGAYLFAGLLVKFCTQPSVGDFQIICHINYKLKCSFQNL